MTYKSYVCEPEHHMCWLAVVVEVRGLQDSSCRVERARHFFCEAAPAYQIIRRSQQYQPMAAAAQRSAGRMAVQN
jgi:hypothetical protein